ncbi:unnamed protein product [Staurois parvus]|uniref:Uncharacterized protein n=1 Tax=Staurois parvus TaxID=386267 RepID=A0ABN9AVF9_9NEOB|nr:unnamed protein product [Staurois parvus]
MTGSGTERNVIISPSNIMSGKTARTSVSPTMHHSPISIPRKSWSFFNDLKARPITGLV